MRGGRGVCDGGGLLDGRGEMCCCGELRWGAEC